MLNWEASHTESHLNNHNITPPHHAGQQTSRHVSDQSGDLRHIHNSYSISLNIAAFKNKLHASKSLIIYQVESVNESVIETDQ